jgi:hypothetical protein
MQYGTVVANGKSYSFSLSPTPTVPTHGSNVYSTSNKSSHTPVGDCGNFPTNLEKTVGTVGEISHTRPQSCPHPKASSGNDLSATVGTVGRFSISENPPIDENVKENSFNPESVARFKDWGYQKKMFEVFWQTCWGRLL